MKKMNHSLTTLAPVLALVLALSVPLVACGDDDGGGPIDGTWQVSTLRRIVSNRFYTGRREIDGETVMGKHEPIISCELFGRATAGGSSAIRATHRRRSVTLST